MNASLAFWNRIAAGYAAQPIANPAAYAEKLARTSKLLRPDMELLEFGCGTGGTALIHAPHVRAIRAIDYSAEMIAIARAKAESQGIVNVRFDIADIETLAAGDGSFDMVLGMSILHLVPDRRAVIDKVRRLLKPGGFFVSSSACLGDMSILLQWALPVAAWTGLVPRVRVFGANDLVGDLEASGFVLEDRWQPKPGEAVFLIARKP